MTGRIAGWRGRLDTALGAVRHVPHGWTDGRDCLLGLAGPVIVALTGEDRVARWRGRYTTMHGALRVMRADGFDTLADLVASILPENGNPATARLGDVVVLPADDGFGGLLGVVAGERVFVLGDDGLLTLDRALIQRAFKVGW
ncbi:DUF6950 family protein [Haematobacter massiliensis]|uniref:DUF6950 family protein n=1 Tax=Haematobacter massiliensis TaxID=195105 RepID=UPI0023F23609|nr:hypothetical protein [Haematobacter massiliensis]